MRKFVSIVIPTYNYDQYISDAISSILSQTYTLWEIIVVDDGSVDNTESIVLSFQDSRIRYIYQDNKGANTARNKGIKEAKGEYIIFLDADDILDNEHIEKYLKIAKKNPGANIYGPWIMGRIKNGQIQVYCEQGKCPGKDLLEYWIGNWWISSCCILWPRSTVLALGGWDDSLHANQDGDIAMRALINKFPFIYCETAPKAFVRKHKDTQSITNTISIKTYESKYKVLIKIESLLKEKHNYIARYKRALALKHLFYAEETWEIFPDFSKKCFNKFKELNGFAKPPGTYMNWIFLYLLGLEKKKKLAKFIGNKFPWRI